MKKIKYYHKNSDVIAYEKTIIKDGYWNERTYDNKGNILTFKNSDDYWFEKTYNENGNLLTFKDSYGNYKID